LLEFARYAGRTSGPTPPPSSTLAGRPGRTSSKKRAYWGSMHSGAHRSASVKARAMRVVSVRVVPEMDYGLDPRGNLLGRRQPSCGGRQTVGQRQYDPGTAQGLGDASPVRADDRDAVDHRLDRNERLVLPPERRHEADPRQSPELSRVGRMSHQVDIA